MAQSKAFVLIVLFLEVLALVGSVAYFAGQHREHLNALQEQLAVIEKSAKASEAALASLRICEREIADARREVDEKLADAENFDGCLRYEYYGRLLREDAARRAGSSTSGGTDVPLR